MRVRFLQRYGAHWPGADPILCEPELSQLLAEGICEPFDKPEPKAPEPVAVEPAEVAAEAPAPDPTAAIRRGGRRR